MEDEIVIKQEPFDIAPDTNFNYDEDIGFDNYQAINEMKDEFRKEITDTAIMKQNIAFSTTSAKYDKLSILGEKSNLITVSASESIDPLDDLCLSEILKNQDDHDYAQYGDEMQLFFKHAKNSKTGKYSNLQNQPSHKCRKNCGKKFKPLTERALHESYDHKSVLRTIKCNFCNENFESFLALTRHMPEHRNVQRYVCTHCSICCSSYQDLQNHWKLSRKCCSGERETEKKIPQAELEESRKISILKSTLSLEQKKTPFSYQEKYELNMLSQQGKPPETLSPLLLLPHIFQSQAKQLSFAEETKAFASKYQLKSSLVAKKRTSALVINPENCQKIKKNKKFAHQDFEIIPKYAIPNAIGPSNNGMADPDLNIKIKEELPDQYDEFDPLISNEIQVKNEPIDDYIEVKNEYLDEPIEESFTSDLNTNEFVPDLNKNFQTPETNDTAPSNKFPIINGASLKGLKIINLESNKFNKNLVSLERTEKSNTLPLKNVKILKLAPNAKIIKVHTVKMDSVKTFNEKTTFTKTPINETDLQTSKTVPVIPIKISHWSSQPNLDSTTYSNDIVPVKKEIAIQENYDENNKSKLELELIENSISKGNQRKRINSVPRQVLRLIEQQPENLKRIEELQRQIKLAESVSTTTFPTLNQDKEIQSLTKEQKNTETESWKNTNVEGHIDLPPPTSLYLLITENSHPELIKSKREYRNFRFSWMCPRCPKRYEQKHAFMGHLVSSHGMCREEFTKLIVEVRPFLNNGLKVTKKPNHSNEFKKSVKLKEEPKEKMEKKIKRETLSTARWCCPNCNRTCSSRTMLIDHMAGNCSRVPLYQCSKCSKSFYSASTLNCHMTIHTGELPYSCSYCDKRFRTRGQVTVHHRIHTGERPFKCQICSQAFTHRETLISHLSRHIGMKRYRCYACGKQFSCVSGLKTHHEFRPNTCGRVKLNTRAVGPRVRVVRGQVLFEPQPEINPYLRTEDPQDILSEIQNNQKMVS